MSTQRSFGNKEMSYYMLVIITYDVNTENEKGRKRLRNVAKYCVAHGQRVQNSVFECILDASQYIKVKYDLVNLIKFEVDSIRFYCLGNNYVGKVEHFGAKATYETERNLFF